MEALWKEAIQAHRDRNEWQDMHFRRRSSPGSPFAPAARAMRLASQAQYGQAVRIFTKPPFANPDEPASINVLQEQRPVLDILVRPRPLSARPGPPEVSETEVLDAVRRLNPNSAAGPDRMSPKLLHLIANTSVSPKAGVTGLSIASPAVTFHLEQFCLPVLPRCYRFNRIRERLDPSPWAKTSHSLSPKSLSLQRSGTNASTWRQSNWRLALLM